MYRRTGRVDAIHDYSRRLVGALCESGVPARYVSDGLSAAARTLADPDWILIQYNAFSYGHWGVAPALIPQAFALRRRTGAPLGVAVHEAWVDSHDRARPMWRSAVMGTYQHAQLAALLGVADVVLATTEVIAGRIGHGAIPVPVGSNVPALPITREDARRRLGFGDELVVALFGTGHPSRALEYATAAIELLAEVRDPAGIRVLNLGLAAPELGMAPVIAVETTGLLEVDDLSIRLHASDIMLLPFADGVSTRRTTLMAALAHRLPVVGLSGAGTDSVLAASPQALTLTPVGDVRAFAQATLELVSDQKRLRAVGQSGYELYRRNFDWPVTAGLVAAALGIPAIS